MELKRFDCDRSQTTVHEASPCIKRRRAFLPERQLHAVSAGPVRRAPSTTQPGASSGLDLQAYARSVVRGGSGVERHQSAERVPTTTGFPRSGVDDHEQ